MYIETYVNVRFINGMGTQFPGIWNFRGNCGEFSDSWRDFRFLVIWGVLATLIFVVAGKNERYVYMCVYIYSMNNSFLSSPCANRANNCFVRRALRNSYCIDQEIKWPKSWKMKGILVEFE